MAMGRLAPTAAPPPNDFDPYSPSPNLNATEYMFEHEAHIRKMQRESNMRGSRGSEQHVKFMDHIRRMGMQLKFMDHIRRREMQRLLHQEMSPNEFNNISPKDFYALDKYLTRLKEKEDLIQAQAAHMRYAVMDASSKARTETKPKLTWLEEMRAEINEWLPKVA